MARVFLSHSSSDNREAVALKRWLVAAEPGLANEIFLDLDRNTGIRPGVRWKEALKQANERCEAVICLITQSWDSSHECRAEFRTAESMNKPIYAVRLERLAGRDITSEWQRCDLFGDGPTTRIELGPDEPPVEFLTEGLLRLRDALRAAGLAADTFRWPPRDDSDRSPYRGWQALESVDAAIYFGRDAQIGKALGEIRALRTSGANSLFVILGPSGVGKSSFLRAGLLPRLSRDTRHFLPMPIVRPGRHGLTGDRGLARSVHTLRSEQGLRSPSLGQIKDRIEDVGTVRGWLHEAQQAALKREVGTPGGVPPTVVLPVDQGEELVGADAGEEGSRLLAILGALATDDATTSMSTIVALTIRSDRYEPLQTAPALAAATTRIFDDLKPMPLVQFKEVICGPARRVTEAGGRVEFAPDLVDRLLADWSSGADTLPLLSLTLARLYNDYGDGLIGLDEYRAMGGMRGVVQTEVAELLDPDPEARRRQLDVLRSAFVPWLATINPDNDQPMRRVARWFDLPPESHFLLDEFVERRLLLKDERDGEIVVEVALESLLRQWDALAGWLDVHAADLKDADALERAAVAWQSNGRRDEWLLAGDRLADAESLSARAGFRDRLNSAREFLHASRQREDDRREAEKQRREAEIIAAREHQEAAEALAAVESRAKEEAQAYAGTLRRRAWILRAALALVLVVAVFAVALSFRLADERRQKDEQYRQAVAERLNAGSGLLFDGQVSGQSDDVLAMQAVLAAREVPDAAIDDDALINALVETRGLKMITQTEYALMTAAASPDGRRFVSGDVGGMIQLWDAQTLAKLGDPVDTGTSGVASANFALDGGRVISVGVDGTVQLWSVLDDRLGTEPLRESSSSDDNSRAVFSPDGEIVATVGIGGSILLWNADDLVLQQEIRPTRADGTQAVSVVAFAPSGHELVTGFDTTVTTWNLETGEPIRSIDVDSPVASVAFSKDGRLLAIGDDAGDVALWDAWSQTAIGAGAACRGASMSALAFSSDGRRLASGGMGNTICLWDTSSVNLIGQLSGHETEVVGVAFAPGDDRLISGSVDSTLRLWSAGESVVVTTPQPVVDLAFSPDGRTVVSSDLDHIVRQWDSSTGLATGPTIVVPGDVASASYSDDGRTLYTFQGDRIRVWDPASGTELGQETWTPVRSLLMSYDDARHRLVAATSAGIEIWDTTTMTPIGDPIVVDSPIIALSLSNDGHRVAAASADWTIRVWDTESREPLGVELEDNGWDNVLRFSPDGRRIAAGGFTRTARVWDIESGDSVGDIMWHNGIVGRIRFSPDGETLATASADGTVRLWDVATGEQLGPALRGHTGNVTDIEFNAEGTMLASSGADSTIRIWPVPVADPAALCAKLSAGLTPEEWEIFVGNDIEYVGTCTHTSENPH